MNIINRFGLKTKKGISYFEIPDWKGLHWIQHAFLTRRGGMSNPPYDSLNLDHRNGDQEETVSKNRNRVAQFFGFDSNRLILLDQRHQDNILLLKEPFLSLPKGLEFDAMITNASNLILGILTADCIPILIVDQKKRVIAAIHAGRQGTALQITKKVLKRMGLEFGCLKSDLLIGVGPSIGPCCYEIDEKSFHSGWRPFSILKGGGKWKVNLAQINLDQIKDEGIQDGQIFWVNLCTHCHSDLFFSYRKEGQTGRQLSFIGIVE